MCTRAHRWVDWQTIHGGLARYSYEARCGICTRAHRWVGGWVGTLFIQSSVYFFVGWDVHTGSQVGGLAYYEYRAQCICLWGGMCTQAHTWCGTEKWIQSSYLGLWFCRYCRYCAHCTKAQKWDGLQCTHKTNFCSFRSLGQMDRCGQILLISFSARDVGHMEGQRRMHTHAHTHSATLVYLWGCGQNHIYMVCIRSFWQGNHQICGHIRCIYTSLANPIYLSLMHQLQINTFGGVRAYVCVCVCVSVSFFETWTSSDVKHILFGVGQRR